MDIREISRIKNKHTRRRIVFSLGTVPVGKNGTVLNEKTPNEKRPVPNEKKNKRKEKKNLKDNLFKSITKKNLNNNLEAVLSSKEFSEETKNVLLNIFYKIENGYNDYKTVKRNTYEKKEYIKKSNKNNRRRLW